MSLIYVTGIAGSGKSTVCKELKKRGYDSYDVDQPGISAAYDNKTGNIVKVPDSDVRPPKWFESHSWRMVDGAIDTLKERAKLGTVFLCGATTANENAGVFDQTIYLHIDEPTLRKRLAKREGNDFGKSEHELNQILAFHKTATDKYKNDRVKIVDATQTLNNVVDEILKQI
jgi:dephospho-CoA kinase